MRLRGSSVVSVFAAEGDWMVGVPGRKIDRASNFSEFDPALGDTDLEAGTDEEVEAKSDDTEALAGLYGRLDIDDATEGISSAALAFDNRSEGRPDIIDGGSEECAPSVGDVIKPKEEGG
jgi:hypothetical protein